MKDQKSNVKYLGITSFLTDVSSEMIFSIMPLFMAGLGISKAWIGVIEGIAEAASNLFKTISGWISDRTQARKPLVLVGYTLSSIVKPFLALTNFWYQVLAVRFIDRIGKGIRTSPRDALIAESVGLHRAMDISGAVVGALLASLLLFIFSNYFNMPAMVQYRNIFWLSVIPGVLSVLFLAVFVKDIKHKIDLAKEGGALSGLKSQFKLFLAISAFFELAKFSYVLFILRAADLGVAIPLIPILYLAYNVIYAVFAQSIGQLADHIGIRKVLMVGYVLFCFTHLGFASATTQSQIWMFFVVFGIATAIIEVAPPALVAHFSTQDNRAAAFGYYHTTIGLVALPATAIAGLLWDIFDPMVCFTYGATVALVALVLFMVSIKEPKKSNS